MWRREKVSKLERKFSHGIFILSLRISLFIFCLRILNVILSDTKKCHRHRRQDVNSLLLFSLSQNWWWTSGVSIQLPFFVMHFHANEVLLFLKPESCQHIMFVFLSLVPLLPRSAYPCVNDCIIFPFVLIVMIHYLKAYSGNRLNMFFINCCSIAPLVYKWRHFYNNTLSHQMSHT